jgi:rhodanese-related sulfurtransferase
MTRNSLAGPPLLLAALLATIVATPAPAQSPAGGAARDSFRITVAQLAQWLPRKDFVLVNVHVPYAGEIPGTDLHVPYNRIAQHLDQLPEDRGARIVVYCRSGPMSAQAAQTLRGLGYNQVYDVSGGMRAWTNAGYPVDDTRRPPAK